MLSDRRFGRVASIYDIHGNLPALNAVLAQIRRADVDLVVVGGDVLPGPMPRETLECLLQLDLPVQFIHGNGDRVVREQMEGIEDTTLPDKVREVVRWTAQQLDVGHQHVLSGWAATLRLEIAGLGDVLFCHATPRNDTEIFSKLTAVSRLLPVFEPANASVVICGHTHMQFDRPVGKTRVVNAGSVGMPFGRPGAYWVLLGPDVQLQYSSYDLTAAAERIERTDYPQAHEFAAIDVLTPRSEKETLDLFAKLELR